MTKKLHKGQEFVTTRMLPPGPHNYYYTVGGEVQHDPNARRRETIDGERIGHK